MSEYVKNGGEFDNLAPANTMFLRITHPGIEHVVNPRSGRQYVRYVPGVEYPDTTDPNVSEILLPKVAEIDMVTYLELPDNYVTFAQALNDSIGNDPTPETLTVAKSLFSKLGVSLNKLAETAHVLPESLDYRAVLVGRHEEGIRILPPMILEPVEPDDYSRRNRRTLLTVQLLASCLQGAGNSVQRRSLPSVFKGFTENFKG